MLFLCHNFIVKKCFISHLMVTKSNQSHITSCTIIPWAMIGCDVKYDLRGEEEPATLTPGHRESCVWSAQAQWPLLPPALQRNTRLRITATNTNTTLIYQAYKPEILDPRPPLSGPGVSGCRHWLSVKVRSSRRSHLPSLTTVRDREKRGDWRISRYWVKLDKKQYTS